ncbi:transcriptional Coactivator p15-domain-containing protein [Pholiota molesta]|nr:transcriptional Coactivator p15-domain-containing protein [Pholiota molesta]
MPKRKPPVSSDEASDSGGSDAPISENKKKMAMPSIKKPKYPKTASESTSQTPEGGSSKHDSKIHTNSEGEKYVDLGKKKRATVRSFKKVALLDIREYYGADGEEKPGKKGISLNLDQWKVLKEGSDAIDKLFAELESKK